METYQANRISMWSCVNDNKREKVFAQLSNLYEIMDSRFSGVLFRNTLDYIFNIALLPEGDNYRFVNRSFRKFMPRTEKADYLLNSNRGFNTARKHIKVEHITSIKTLGLKFQERDFYFVCENFNVCIVTNDEYKLLGKGCGHERYFNHNIKLMVPLKQMIKKIEARN